jgi:hypothetical protein
VADVELRLHHRRHDLDQLRVDLHVLAVLREVVVVGVDPALVEADEAHDRRVLLEARERVALDELDLLLEDRVGEHRRAVPRRRELEARHHELRRRERLEPPTDEHVVPVAA